MKKIEAIIRRSKYRTVKEALHDVGITFFSYWDVTGVGNEKKGSVYRGVSYSTTDIQRRFISLVIPDDKETVAIDAILTAAKTGEIGDGKVFVSDITEAYRIRTATKGVETLS
ncbi:P-II family nitrogen regulator [Aquimarina intermedia]|uniref:Nitrogen regulatory protein P-II family n=1 Tax=Aquimarina intermedia TaxID=350814 RepID=A0A5S5C0K8_9FLAO|nr:P-II family nitrogen regulator [Aquimarina intermedia]TYP72148.1 nitrogen regulatory protein P-II family [Aquimarina intermedia]